MRNRENIANLLILGFLFFIIILIFSSGNSKAVIGLSDPTALETHAAIAISGDAQFTAPNGVRSGTGTLNDPFIISDWTIDAHGSTGISIRQYSTKYWSVRNCEVYNSSGSTYGFHIEGVGLTGGNIWNCLVRDCTGYILHIYLNINNVTINNTMFRDCKYGIYMDRTVIDFNFHHNIVQNISNGQLLYHYSGVNDMMYNSSFTNNIFKNISTTIGFQILQQNKNKFRNNIISNNTFDDTPCPVIVISSGYNIKINDNDLINVSKPTYGFIISTADFHFSYMIGNYIRNDSSQLSGILIRGSYNLIDNNTIVDAIYIGISIQNYLTTNTDENIIRGNHIFKTWDAKEPSNGQAGIEILTSHNIVEYNLVEYHPATGIGTFRNYQGHNNIFRYNTVIGCLYYDIDVEHNHTGSLVYGNVVSKSWVGIVIEGNDSLCFNNVATDCEWGYTIQGNRSVGRNNRATDCTYGFIQLMGQHYLTEIVSTGDNVQISENTMTNCEYGILFMKGKTPHRWVNNCTFWGNVYTNISTANFAFGEYDPYNYNDLFGENVSQTWDTLTENWMDTDNLIINSAGTNTIYGMNTTGNDFKIGILWKNALVTFHKPTSWDYSRCNVEDTNTSLDVPWIQGSIIFMGALGHTYDIIYTPPPPLNPIQRLNTETMPQLIDLTIWLFTIVIVMTIFTSIFVLFKKR